MNVYNTVFLVYGSGACFVSGFFFPFVDIILSMLLFHISSLQPWIINIIYLFALYIYTNVYFILGNWGFEITKNIIIGRRSMLHNLYCIDIGGLYFVLEVSAYYLLQIFEKIDYAKDCEIEFIL